MPELPTVPDHPPSEPPSQVVLGEEVGRDSDARRGDRDARTRISIRPLHEVRVLDVEAATLPGSLSDPTPMAGLGSPDPLVGTNIAGRYRILGCIGRGGMGLVYRVEHTEIGKLLAVKLLAGELSHDRRLVRRFKREAMLVSRLSHPNTVHVFDFGSSEGLTWLVMELVPGRDLAQVVETEGPLEPLRLARIAIQICSSLAEAHGLGIVHRDMKLGNIMVAPCCKDGADLAKVLDFGLAKLRDAPELVELSGGGVIGTPQYMAPEQIEAKALDGRTDIYALGALMYRALTGKPVFNGHGVMEVFRQHLSETPVPPHERAPHLGIPEALSRIVLRALEKSPADRYQRVEDLQSALIEFAGFDHAVVEVLLDAGRMRAMHEDAARAEVSLDRDTRPSRVAATRDELLAYERKLRRQRFTGVLTAVGVLAATGIIGARFWQAEVADAPFSGFESEPNNLANEANPVPFGSPVSAMIGKRLDSERSDRDLFRIEIPAGVKRIAIHTSALPNMALCTLVFESGEERPLAKLCTGRPNLDLNVPAYRLNPGSYLFAVLQDRERYGAADLIPVVENVSDSYQLLVSSASITDAAEVEPNDSPAGADLLSPGGTVEGSFAWAGDIDVVCVGTTSSSDTGRVRWVVRDAVDRVRDRGVVLEVVQRTGAELGPATTVRSALETHAPAIEPPPAVWSSEPFSPGSEPRSDCVRLKLRADTSSVPCADVSSWSVALERAP